jgi:small conductance mechanosensitive channel
MEEEPKKSDGNPEAEKPAEGKKKRKISAKWIEKDEKKADEAAKNIHSTLYEAGLAGKDSNVKSWKTMTKKEKFKSAMSWFFVVVAIVYVIIVGNAATWFGEDSPLAQVLSNDPISGTGVWYLDNAKPLFGTIYYILVLLGLSKILRAILAISFRKSGKKAITIVRLTSSAIKYLFAIVLIFVILSLWGVDTSALLASAGILALIIGLGAQTLVADLVSGLSIVFEDQFEVGDTVVIDNFRGVVYEIGLTTTKLVDAAGNQKIIRNSSINTCINLSRDYSLAITDISVDYDSDLDAVRKMLVSDLPKMSKGHKLIIGSPEYLGVTEFADSGINIRVIARCREEDKFAATRELNEIVYQILISHGVEIPFPQVVVSKRKEK